MEKLLEVKNLTTCFVPEGREIPLVDNVSFFINKNSVLGFVGESGCGKTMTALSLTNLLPGKNCKIISGEINFKHQTINQIKEKDLKQIRGKEITYIFQEPATCLNPVLNIKEQLAEVARLYRPEIKPEQTNQFLIKQLEQVGISMPAEKLLAFPHQLSGGEKQRVMIAMSMIPRPALLIADEPTTALDVTIQAQILLLLDKLKRETGVAILFISHDLNVIAELSDYIAVMYAGQIVEFAQAKKLLANPRHPYTQGLFECLPKKEHNQQNKLKAIIGEVPKSGNFPEGCRFHPRCPVKFDKCAQAMPPLFKLNPDQEVRCWLCSD
ncbi:MAG: ABC transporter ATP-binding protein [Candidatus Omnitrophica bacterium]|nr:ABC transporter ATP-binding protein [Candidatus Omnitrophota bacterium]